jgi:hypothetical protein
MTEFIERSHAPRARPTARFLRVSACYSGLIVATILLILSFVSHGHGMLGLSFGLSIGILGSIVATALVGLARIIWRETSPIALHDDTVAGTKTPRRKCEFKFDEWFAILAEAEQEFYVAGHTMGKWCDESRKDMFVSQLRRILAAGGRVTLVMLGSESPQLPILKAATGKDYRGRIAHSVPVLREFETSLDAKHRTRLRITKLEDDGPIPYMVVGNERRLVTATYLARTDSDDMPCIELNRESESARAIYDDFHKLATSES